MGKWGEIPLLFIVYHVPDKVVSVLVKLEDKQMAEIQTYVGFQMTMTDINHIIKVYVGFEVPATEDS